MRYTKHSFEELVERFSNPDLEQEWKFVYLRDMGNILDEGGEDAKEVEAFFRDLLDSKDPGYKSIAFRHLTVLECMDEKTGKKLKKFLEEIGNKKIS